MDFTEFTQLYNFSGQTIVITGGAGVLGSEMACMLASCGANVVIMDRDLSRAQAVVDRFSMPDGSDCHGAAFQTDVLQPEVFQKSLDAVLAEFGAIDGLINAAGGNHPSATTNAEKTFFDLPPEAMRWVFDLNLLGTILPSQMVGRVMAEQKRGVILNISSMNAFRPLTRIPAYSAAKAGVSNFTQWLAVYMAQEYSANIRVNALAPGFFLTEQNRFLMTDRETGALTPRAEKILAHTPMARFGVPADLFGAMLWLMSPASAFVTGIVVPIDGGFSAYSGV